MRKKRSLHHKMLIPILLVAVLSWVTGLASIYIFGKKIIENRIGSGFQELARQTGEKVELMIGHRVDEIKTFSSLGSIKSALKKKDKGIAEDLKSLIENNPKEYLIITDEKGRLIASTRDLPESDFSNEPWWKKAFFKGDIFISDVRYDDLIKSYSLTLASPIILEGVPKGVLSITRSTDRIFKNVIMVKTGKTDYTMLVSSDGQILFCPILPLGTHLHGKLEEAIFKDKAGWTITSYDIHYPGRNSISGFAPLGITFPRGDDNFGGKRWFIFTSQDPSETYATIRVLFKWIALTGLFGIIALAFIGLYLARRIIRPISELHKGAKVIGKGNLNYRLNIKTGDEIQDLADGFNEMVEKIARHEGELERLIEERTKQLKEVHEELLRKERLAVMGQMAGSVAHEIKNPLAGIKGAIHVLKLKLKGVDDNVKEYFDMMIHEINVANKIVEDLLGFSRIRPPERQKVVISGLISEAVESFKFPGNIRIKIDPTEDLPMVYIDKIQIRQVFLNIISNAIHAMQDGGELTIKANLTGPEDKYIDVSFADTGCGIPRENIDKIFQPLFTTKMRGIGLGLAVSRWFVEANGGKIGVESKEGKGTTFSISLPTLIPGKS